jgi:hypothetical protein
MQPESSDGLASVGTILPEEKPPVAGRLFLFFESPPGCLASGRRDALAGLPARLLYARVPSL